MSPREEIFGIQSSSTTKTEKGFWRFSGERKKNIPIFYGYALINNHYPLLIETPRANLSRIMRGINTSYTVYINRRDQRSGPLFPGRFKAILVEQDEYLFPLGRYIHLHPVRAEKGKKPKDYPWTRYPVFIGGKGPPPFWEEVPKGAEELSRVRGRGGRR